MNKKQILSLMFAAMTVPSISILTAQTAEQNRFYIKGDVDGDGIVTIRDVTAIQRILAEIDSATEDKVIRAKVTGNDMLTINDATAIQMFLAEYNNLYSIGEKIYEESSNEKYSVVFYDYDGTTILKTQKVANGETAVPPTNPTKSGASFLGWSGKYDNVTQDETVRAIYSDEKNVFIVSPSAITSSNTVDVLVSIDGKVKTSGFDFNLFYDSNLELVSYDDDLDLDIIATPKTAQNRIRLNFSSISDREKQRDIIQLTFKIKDTTKKNLPISIVINSIKELYNNNPINTNYVIVNNIVNGWFNYE